jgi:hypothetical protein
MKRIKKHFLKLTGIFHYCSRAPRSVVHSVEFLEYSVDEPGTWYSELSKTDLVHGLEILERQTIKLSRMVSGQFFFTF